MKKKKITLEEFHKYIVQKSLKTIKERWKPEDGYDKFCQEMAKIRKEIIDSETKAFIDKTFEEINQSIKE